jgi:hypothetical protein
MRLSQTLHQHATQESATSSTDSGTTASVFGVDATEESAGGDNVTNVAVSAGKTRYLEVPAVTFSGGGGSSAAATASIAGGAVSAITVTNVGSAYTSAPTVTITKPRRVIPTSGVDTALEQFTYATHGLVVGEEVKYNNGGMATSSNSLYNINVTLNGTDMSADDVANAIERKMRIREATIGRGRNN